MVHLPQNGTIGFDPHGTRNVHFEAGVPQSPSSQADEKGLPSAGIRFIPHKVLVLKLNSIVCFCFALCLLVGGQVQPTALLSFHPPTPPKKKAAQCSFLPPKQKPNLATNQPTNPWLRSVPRCRSRLGQGLAQERVEGLLRVENLQLGAPPRLQPCTDRRAGPVFKGRPGC